MFGTTVVQWSFPFQSSAWRRLGSIIDTRRRRSIIVRKFFKGWQRHGCSKENYNRMMNGTNMLVLLQKTCWQLNMHMDKQQTCFQASMHCMFPHRNFSILQWWYLFLLPKFSSTPFDRIEPGWPMQHWSCNKFATIMEHVFVPNIKTTCGFHWISNFQAVNQAVNHFPGAKHNHVHAFSWQSSHCDHWWITNPHMEACLRFLRWRMMGARKLVSKPSSQTW